MSEIIKLYENAEVEKPQINYCKSDNCPFNWKYGICQTKKCPNWTTKQSKCYPSFTAEKQIELIKWLIVHSPNTCLEDEIIVSAFEDSLANIINALWQDLNEEERKQIKEILE